MLRFILRSAPWTQFRLFSTSLWNFVSSSLIRTIRLSYGELSKYLIPAFDTAFLPDPGIFVCIGLNLGTVNIGMVQIHTQQAEHAAVDIVENSIQVTGQFLMDKIAYCHMAGRILFIQHPEEADIRFTQLPDKPDRAVPKLHEGKQYNL